MEISGKRSLAEQDQTTRHSGSLGLVNDSQGEIIWVMAEKNNERKRLKKETLTTNHQRHGTIEMPKK